MSHNNYYLSRHSEAESNTLRILAHTVETGEKYPLTNEGILQATNEALMAGVAFDFIFTSPILRTKQTAIIYHKYLGGVICEDARLIERNDGIFDGKSVDEYLKWYFEKDRDLTFEAPENGENHTEVKNRLIGLIDDLDARFEGKNILLVSHGTPCAILQKVWNGEELPKRNEVIDFPKNKIIKFP